MNMTILEDMEEVLIEFKQEMGFPDRRRELAQELAKHELAPGDLRMICEEISGASRLNTILRDRDKWGPLLADLRRFHSIRLAKENRAGKRKPEPGKGLRDQDQGKTDTVSFFGMTPEEYRTFKWRFIVAVWRHNGWSSEEVEKHMAATPEEQDECLKRFPKGKSFDDALAEYAGKGKKTDASTPGPD